MNSTQYFAAGHAYTSARENYDKWVGIMEKRWKTFQLVSVSFSAERQSWQEITVAYSISDNELLEYHFNNLKEWVKIEAKYLQDDKSLMLPPEYEEKETYTQKEVEDLLRFLKKAIGEQLGNSYNRFENAGFEDI